MSLFENEYNLYMKEKRMMIGDTHSKIGNIYVKFKFILFLKLSLGKSYCQGGGPWLMSWKCLKAQKITQTPTKHPHKLK